MELHENHEVNGDSRWRMEGPAGSGVSHEGLWRTICRRRRIVLAMVSICLGLAAIYIKLATPTYTSTSRVYVEQTGPKIITDTEGVMTQSKNYLHTQKGLLKSKPVLSAALNRPGIRKLAIFDDVDNPVAWLKQTMDVEVGKKDDLISVSFDAKDPVEAAQLVNSIVDSYVTYHTKQKQSSAGTVLDILQKERAQREIELNNNLQAMLEFQKASGVLSLEDAKGNIVIQTVAKLSDSLAEAQLECVEAKADYEAAKLISDDPVKIQQLAEAWSSGPRSTAHYTLEARLHEGLSLMELDLISLEANCTTDHPTVKALRAKIKRGGAQLSDLNKRLTDGYVLVIRQRAEIAKEKVGKIQSMLDQQQKIAQAANLEAAQYAVLESKQRRAERLCEVLDTRIKELNVTEDAGALNINILEVARPDYEPTSPNKAHVIPIALAAGLLFGVLTALGLDHSDRRFRSEEEMVAVLGTPVLGAIPRIPGRQSVFKTGQSVALDPSSQAAEAYRTIRTATYFMPAGNEAKTLLVTSPTQGDGKTTLASNLGIAMAQTGRRTLVIDADFRRPMQHKAFGLSHTPGLTNVLAGEHALDDAIEQTAVDGLDLLPAGATPSNPSEMLNSTEFARLLEELSQSYDRVLVDSPPVLSVTDASILAAMCDVTLLVLKAGSSTRRMAKQARNVLLDVGGAILGVVVNAVSHKQEQYGYYGYGYRCDYRYGQDHKSKPDRRSQQADVPAAPTTALTCSPKTDPC